MKIVVTKEVEYVIILDQATCGEATLYVIGGDDRFEIVTIGKNGLITLNRNEIENAGLEIA